MVYRSIARPAFAAALLCVGLADPTCAAPFGPGDFVTYVQDDWGDSSTAAGALLDANFISLYGEDGYVHVGILGSVGNSAMLFTSSSSIGTYLPASGLPAALLASLVDPTTSPSGIFGGEVLGLQLNVDFSDAHLLGGAETRFGDLVIRDYAPLAINGLTVREYLAQANLALGGALPGYDYASATALVSALNTAFFTGTPSQFARDHLEVAAAPVPEPATISLLGFGLSALAAHRRRDLRRRCIGTFGGERSVVRGFKERSWPPSD